MRDLAGIKKRERETLEEYIRKMHADIPEDPYTGYEFELGRAIQWDIERAEKELATL